MRHSDIRQFIIVIVTIAIVFITHTTSMEVQFEVDMIAFFMVFIRPFVGVDPDDIRAMFIDEE